MQMDDYGMEDYGMERENGNNGATTEKNSFEFRFKYLGIRLNAK